jgi:mono/diheme cytochrome c family protein
MGRSPEAATGPTDRMRSFVTYMAALGLAVLAAGLLATRPGVVSDSALAGLVGDPVAGEAVFWAAGCASCHAAEGAQGGDRLILSGGQRFASDFGVFVAPNVSPHPEAGIGDWDFADFVTALQEGTSPEGRHYYPAFPYTAYRLAERQDLADLWAFWQGLPPSEVPSLAHEVGFPFSIRRAVGVWNLLNLQDDFAIAGDLDAEVASPVVRCAQAGEIVARVIARPRERRGRHHQEALAIGRFLIGFEFVGMHEAVDGVVLRRRLQILADGQEIDIGRAHVVHDLQDGLPILAQAHHDAGFGEHRGVQFLDPLQQAQGMEIARAGPDFEGRGPARFRDCG